MISVRATREGHPGREITAVGWKISDLVPYVALPSHEALYELVRIKNPATGDACKAVVLDVGPWNEYDDRYVFQEATADPGYASDGHAEIRPQAESGTDTTGRPTNGAGIDLGEYVWKALGMTDNSDVLWEFID
jgi:hypothetical protein